MLRSGTTLVTLTTTRTLCAQTSPAYSLCPPVHLGRRGQGFRNGMLESIK
jgi:hypothetical protein